MRGPLLTALGGLVGAWVMATSSVLLVLWIAYLGGAPPSGDFLNFAGFAGSVLGALVGAGVVGEGLEDAK